MDNFREMSTAEISAIGHTVSAVFEDTKLDAPEAIPDTVGSDNIGFKMLQKFGWKGNGLGKREQGITVPVMVAQADSTLGIGKATEYEKSIVEVTRYRKKMDVEIMQTEDMTQKKKEASDRQDSIETDLKRMTQEFYCESCDKRYKSVSEMSNHLSSYDHHHRKRFKEMKEVAKKRKRGFAIGESDEVRKDEIRRKEEKRKAKEMQIRIDKANAMQQLHSPPPVPPPPPPPLSSSSASTITSQAPNLNYNSSAPLVFLNGHVRPDNTVADQSSTASHEVFGPHGMTAAAVAVAVAGSQQGYTSNNSINESNIMHSAPHPHSLTALKDISYTPAIKYPDFDNVSEIAGSTITTVTDIPPIPSKPIVMKFNFSMKKK